MPEEVIVLTGVKETIEALKEFDKDAVKRFNKVINSELASAESQAKGLVPSDPPMSGWRMVAPKNPTSTRGGAGWPAWNASEIADGIVKTKAQRRVRGDYTTSAGGLLNKSAAGAIFEVAGRKAKPSADRTQGAQFLRNLSNRFGKASRLIWAVVDRDGERIRKNISNALDDAKKELQRNLERGK